MLHMLGTAALAALIVLKIGISPILHPGKDKKKSVASTSKTSATYSTSPFFRGVVAISRHHIAARKLRS